MQDGLPQQMTFGWGFANLPRQNIPHVSKQTLIGIVVAISGNVLISFALNLQKLSHKRTQLRRAADATNGAPKPEQRNVNGALPEENEERHEEVPQDGHELHSCSSTTATAALVETQPLIVQPSVNALDYGSAHLTQAGASHATSVDPQAKPGRRGLFSRIVPVKLDTKQGVSTRATLPIEIVTEEAAIHGLSRHNKKDNTVDNPVVQNEGAYLKSKTWCVFWRNPCLESLIACQVAWVSAHEHWRTW